MTREKFNQQMLRILMQPDTEYMLMRAIKLFCEALIEENPYLEEDVNAFRKALVKRKGQALNVLVFE